METKKIAFVFDTNFIVKNQKLATIVEQLDEKYVPYVTQVSIEERKAQQCNAKKKAYKKIEELRDPIKSLVSLKSNDELDKELEILKQQIQKAYENLFKDNIINYCESSEIFSIILHRSFGKIPPFSDVEGASDKGFKDTLMWLSIMDYFKENGECEVLFLTDDKGFTNKAVELTLEFEECTGKRIQIKSNEAINSLYKVQTTTAKPRVEIPNLDSIREQFREILDGICWVNVPNYWGEDNYIRSFKTNTKFDEPYIQMVMDELKAMIQEHIFNKTISIEVFLDRDNRLYDTQKIEMSQIEKLNKFYEEMLKKYPQNKIALIKAITEMLNENYLEKETIDENDIPF